MPPQKASASSITTIFWWLAAAQRVGAVEPEVDPPGRDQVEKMKRRGAVGDRAQHAEVPLQHAYLQAGPAP